MFMKDSEVKKFRKYAKDNRTEMFVQSLFPDKFRDIVTQCFPDNSESFAKLFKDLDFYQKVQEAMAAEWCEGLTEEWEYQYADTSIGYVFMANKGCVL